MALVPRPKFNVEPIAPFTREELERLLHACRYSRLSKPSNRRLFKTERPTYRRGEAICLFLLDTGLRTSEFCALRIADMDMKTGEVMVRHGRAGGAKGGKGRSVYIGKPARKAIWRYLVELEHGEEEHASLFLSIRENPMNKDSLRLLLRWRCKKVNIKKCYSHRFRHTFAINYLRSNGDVFTLQELLGYASLKMVRRYAYIAKIDLQHMHGCACPVENWGVMTIPRYGFET